MENVLELSDAEILKLREEIVASCTPLPNSQGNYCFVCDGIHVGGRRTRLTNAEPDFQLNACDSPHIKSCTCEMCDARRTKEYAEWKDRYGWQLHYHTFEEMENAPPTSFLIDGFLPADAITALAAPVGQRKSLAAANVAHALCTKEPLFDHFAVTKQPSRVLYLCPEMGIRSFTDRLRKLGLMPYIGKTLFCRTMSAAGSFELNELTGKELDGAVVIIDTAVRYLKGDENSSEHMRQFAESVFRLMREGAVAVLLLHHSAKGTKESSELTLENAMRGSGELGAFVSSCWATRLQNPAEPYQSASYFVNVKQRDFESKPFEVTSGPDCRLHIVAEPSSNVVLNGKPSGKPTNADGNEETALAIIKNNPKASLRELARLLKEAGIKRGKSWIGDKRYELLHVGVKTSS
jgi:hypothetical protein